MEHEPRNSFNPKSSHPKSKIASKATVHFETFGELGSMLNDRERSLAEWEPWRHEESLGL